MHRYIVLFFVALLAAVAPSCSENGAGSLPESDRDVFRPSSDASVGSDADHLDAPEAAALEPLIGDAGDALSSVDGANVPDAPMIGPLDSGSGVGDGGFADVNVAIQVVDVVSGEPITEYVNVRYSQGRGSDSVYLSCADAACQAWYITEPIRGNVLIIAGYVAPAEELNCHYIGSQSMPLRVDPKVRQEVVFELSTNSLGCEN